jgi:hypothetical protein
VATAEIDGSEFCVLEFDLVRCLTISTVKDRCNSGLPFVRYDATSISSSLKMSPLPFLTFRVNIFDP